MRDREYIKLLVSPLVSIPPPTDPLPWRTAEPHKSPRQLKHHAQVHRRCRVGPPAVTLYRCICSSRVISGAGLGGLLFALTLQKFAPDVEFHIYESAAELAEIGAGVGFQPRTWFVIRELGLDQELQKIAGNGERPSTWMSIRESLATVR